MPWKRKKRYKYMYMYYTYIKKVDMQCEMGESKRIVLGGVVRWKGTNQASGKLGRFGLLCVC